MFYTNRKAAEILGRCRKTQNDDKKTGNLPFEPTANEGYRWDPSRLVAARFYLDQRDAGLTVKLAGQAATRLWQGMLDYPEAEQLTVVTLENGSKSILPTVEVDLATGYLSGGYLAHALVIDVRNLRARVQRAIDADAAVIGDRDE